MINQSKAAVNAGVHGSTGTEFQKHCALYFLFEKYNDLKDRKYFICIEHHDDFLFCYQNNDELISSIDSYQAKKSSEKWEMSGLYELLRKMTGVGLSLNADSMPKVNNYTHNLEFITNNSIQLSNGVRGKGKNKSITINESNSRLKFTDLDTEIINKIEAELTKLLGKDLEGLKELNNVSLAYIDFPKKSAGQKDSLVGQFNRIFGEKVSDHRAAVDALLLLFRDVENTLNQGNVVKLMDKSKRVSSESINDAIDVITTKTMAFDLWRNEEKEVCRNLEIAIPDKSEFKLNFINSFDRFKDYRQVEHKKILSFVKENRNIMYRFTVETDCILELYQMFRKNISSQLSELSIKAAIYAAYIEVRGQL
ncbi:dsDNA nuclease domain-containing protein [Paenibacillus puerhi]|uniref:dsDNA nuclease domain-containing protein n=1 Tax=Paenibacillus puerhi TaxID=2692622 RepID=UPI00135C7B22|nr:dsDNA nuclease domain-containing protein [Paenibacillus puerhi]